MKTLVQAKYYVYVTIKKTTNEIFALYSFAAHILHSTNSNETTEHVTTIDPT